VKNDATANRIKISRPLEAKSNTKRQTKLDPKITMLTRNVTLSKSHCSSFFIYLAFYEGVISSLLNNIFTNN